MSILKYDILYVMDVTGFDELYMTRLDRYHAKLSRVEKIELHRLAHQESFRSLNRREKGKEPEYQYAMFLLATDQLLRAESNADRMRRMTEEERRQANQREIARMVERKKRQTAPVRVAIEQCYHDIRQYLEAGLSWRQIAELLGEKHPKTLRKVNYSYVRSVFMEAKKRRES